MGLREILIYPDARLREKSKPVATVTDEVRALLNDMAETMYAAPGIGLAAPQIGVGLRAIVIDVGADEESGRTSRLYKLLNPQIVNAEGKTEGEEGCLSIPDLRETVSRSEKVVVEAVDEEGKPITIEADGLLAVCLQHEIDHLDGVLFIDRLSRLKRELLKPQLRELERLERS